MVELLRSNDMVLLSYIMALLAGEGMEAVLLDGHTSIMEGSIGAIQRRLMVAGEDEVQARRLIREAGLADEI